MTPAKKSKKYLSTLGQLLLSCVAGSFGVVCVAIPNGLAVTGTTGFAMALSTLISLDYTLIYYISTVIIGGLAWRYLGKEEVSKILALSILFPLVMYLFRFLPISLIFEDKLIATAVFGIFFGISYGCSYRNQFSYGASDTLAKILVHTCMKQYSLKQVMNIVEGVIVLFLLTVYDINLVVYSLIGEVVYVSVMNLFVNYEKEGRIVMVTLRLFTHQEATEERFRTWQDKLDARITWLSNGTMLMEFSCREKQVSDLKKYLEHEGVSYQILVMPVLKSLASSEAEC